MKVKVTFLKDVGGQADPANRLENAFIFRAGQQAEINGKLAARWCAAGICTERELTVRELIDLRMPV